MKRTYAPLWLLLPGLLAQPASANIDIVFDYTYDNGFLTGANSSRQAVLNAAAAVYENRLQDQLSAITSSGTNQADFAFLNPYTPVDALPEFVYGASIAANEIRIYVGGSNDLNSGISYIRANDGTILGTVNLGGVSASGTPAFIDNALSRGQAGALGSNASQTDWGFWGGSISFDTAANWHFDSNSSGSFTGYDFYSAALHEIGHILGFGKSPSYFNLVANGQFNGAKTVALAGAAPMLNGTDLAHWQDGLLFAGQLNAMNPILTNGQRLNVTELDFAALDDLGWEVSAVPEAETWAMMLASLGLISLRLRRRT